MQKKCGAGLYVAGLFAVGLLRLTKNIQPRRRGRLKIGLRDRILPLLAIQASTASAGETKSWLQGEYSDFEKGTIKNLSLRSDGLVSLAPQFREIFNSSSAYLWTMAHDSAGNLYAGGGPDAKLYRISP